MTWKSINDYIYAVMGLFLYADLVFSNAETLHLCCDIGRGNWLGRVLKIMCSNGVVCMLVWSLAMRF